jgi:hypothetical protein
MTLDSVGVQDIATATLDRGREAKDVTKVRGYLDWELRGPDGEIKASGREENIITAVGAQYYAERANGITTLPIAGGMRLGQGTTAAAATGAGAAIVTYITGSNAGFASGPTSAANGNARNISWTATWAAGTATATGIAEVVITNEAVPPTNVQGTAANTISRALFSSAFDKAAGDSLTVTYVHTVG